MMMPERQTSPTSNDNNRTPDQTSLSERERNAVVHASTMIARNLANPPTLAQLSHATGLSQRRLTLGFRVMFKATIFGHLRSTRLETARRMMEETDMPLKQIAFEIGYGHANNLIAAYRERFGEPPRRHVKNASQGEAEQPSTKPLSCFCSIQNL